jgi:hypothetical protein
MRGATPLLPTRLYSTVLRHLGRLRLPLSLHIRIMIAVITLKSGTRYVVLANSY